MRGAHIIESAACSSGRDGRRDARVAQRTKLRVEGAAGAGEWQRGPQPHRE